MCENCVHKEVCNKKDLYKKAQEAVNRVDVPIEDRTTKKLNLFEFIKPVVLECIHFKRVVAVRQRTWANLQD